MALPVPPPAVICAAVAWEFTGKGNCGMLYMHAFSAMKIVIPEKSSLITALLCLECCPGNFQELVECFT